MNKGFTVAFYFFVLALIALTLQHSRIAHISFLQSISGITPTEIGIAIFIGLLGYLGHGLITRGYSLITRLYYFLKRLGGL